MKKTISYLIIVFIGFMFITIYPKADDCTYKDQQALNKEVSNIKMSYEFIDNDPLHYHFKINITNIPDDLKLVITDDYSSNNLELTKDNTDDGIYSFETLIATRKVTFNIDIYSIGNSCYNKKLRSKKLITPRYNPYSSSYICEQVPDFEYCNKFKDTSSLTYEQFIKKGEQYKAKFYKNEEEQQKRGLLSIILSFIIKYKWYFIIGILVIGLAIGLFFVIRKIKIARRGV